MIRIDWLDCGNGDFSRWRSEGKTGAAGTTIIDGVIREVQSMAFRTYLTTAAQPTPTPATPRPAVTVPPTSTVAPAGDAGTGTATLALFAVLGAVAGGAVVLAGRSSRS